MNTENEKGYRCNCPGCDGRPHLPCEAIAELDELREKLREAGVKSSFDDVAFERRGEIIKDLEKQLETKGNPKTTYVIQFTHSIIEPYYWCACDDGVCTDKESAISQMVTYWRPYFELTKFRVIRRIETDPIEEVIA